MPYQMPCWMSVLSVHHNFTYVFKVAQGLWLEFHSVHLTLKVTIFLGCCPTKNISWNKKMEGWKGRRQAGREGQGEGRKERWKWESGNKKKTIIFQMFWKLNQITILPPNNSKTNTNKVIGNMSQFLFLGIVTINNNWMIDRCTLYQWFLPLGNLGNSSQCLPGMGFLSPHLNHNKDHWFWTCVVSVRIEKRVTIWKIILLH